MHKTDNQTCAAVEDARRRFRAVLAPWASDLMALRARGLDRPSRRYALGLVLRPTSTGSALSVSRGQEPIDGRRAA